MSKCNDKMEIYGKMCRGYRWDECLLREREKNQAERRFGRALGMIKRCLVLLLYVPLMFCLTN